MHEFGIEFDGNASSLNEQENVEKQTKKSLIININWKNSNLIIHFNWHSLTAKNYFTNLVKSNKLSKSINKFIQTINLIQFI